MTELLFSYGTLQLPEVQQRRPPPHRSAAALGRHRLGVRVLGLTRVDYPGRAAQVTVVVASWCTTTWPSTAISQ
jgi:hypothetical protein